VSELRAAARSFAPIFAAVVAIAVVAGIVVAVWADQSVVRWVSWSFYVVGALMIAYPFVMNPPPNPRNRGVAAQDDPGAQALRGEIPLLVAGGVLLLVVATLMDLL
jgi:hypothetical protein